MLEPHDRRLLLESLRPPEGYELDFAIATTFTLDLLSLLTAPLGFTFFELDGDAADAASAIDPLVLLRTIRRYADRMAIFCQAGRIAVPRKQQLLFANLEESIVEVTPAAPKGVFHPKIWVLRFTGEGVSVRYRLLCLSRNLTFDCSWDTSLVLDGVLVDRQVGYAANRPLSDFIAALPGLAVTAEIPPRILANVQTAAAELRKVDFEVPEPFTEYGFWPLGIKGYTKWPFAGRATRRLVISPFLSRETLSSLAHGGQDNVLVSRLDTLQAFSEDDLSGFDSVFALDPSAGAELQSTVDAESDAEAVVAGLHAKLFVADDGWNASVFTGSANATVAAFARNVEFLVELVGKKSTSGVDAVLGVNQDEGGLRGLLVAFEPLEKPIQSDEVQERLDERLDLVRRSLAGIPWLVEVDEVEGGFSLTLSARNGSMPEQMAATTAYCRPITIADTGAHQIEGDGAIRFSPVSFEAITAFFAFDISVTEGERKAHCQFVVTAHVSGAPADRRERLLKAHLQNPEQLIRFLLLLLSSDDPGETDLVLLPTTTAAAGSPLAYGGGPQQLLEPLLHALASNMESLDQVAKTLADLTATAEGRSALPAGLERIWAAVWEARQRRSTPSTQHDG